MTVDRGVAASWAIGMGLLLGAVAGTVVSTRTPGEEVRRVAGFALLFVPALYAMIVSRWDHWHPKNPYVRFAVLFLGGFATIGLVTVPVVLLFGGAGLVATVAEFLAAIAGFGVAAWIAFYGGDERIWAVVVDRLDVDW
jgi:uncharacterized membrane protein YfcA